MKRITFISILSIIMSCSFDNNGLEIDSTEAISRLHSDLKLRQGKDLTKDIYFWEETSSSTLAYFKTDSATIFRAIIKLEMKPDTIRKDIWIPEDSPSWFAPSIDPSDKLNKTWIKEYDDRKIFLQINEGKTECFFANLK